MLRRFKMKAVNKKNIDEFMEFVNKVMKEDGFILQARIETWLNDNGVDYFRNVERFGEWKENC